MPIALIARTWIGNPTPSVVLGAVSLLPSEPSAATRAPPGSDAVVGWRPAFALPVSHGSQLGLAPRVTGADEQDVAGPHPHALVALRRLEVLAEHVLARLDPGNTAHARHVEQHAAPDQAVLEDVDRTGLGALRGDRLVRLAVVETTVVGDVAEGVDVAVAVVVVVDADVVLGEAHGPRPDVDVGQHRHVVVGGLGHVDARLGLERLAERDRGSAANEPGGGGDPGGREMVQRASLAVVVPAAPVGDRFEELAELSAVMSTLGIGAHPRARRHPA